MAQILIKKGDTLSKIAKQNNVSVRDILNSNPNIKNPNLIYAGQSLNIPDKTQPNQTRQLPDNRQQQISDIQSQINAIRNQLGQAQTAGYSGNQQIQTDVSGNILPASQFQFDASGNPIQNQPVANIPTDTGQISSIQDVINQFLDRLKQNGMMINPNAQITPASIGELMAAGAPYVDPYYLNQLKVAKDQFLTSLGYNQQQLLQNEQQAANQYGINYEDLASKSAERGFAQSGIRQKEESQLAQSTQLALDQARQTFNIGNTQAAQSFAQTYGGQNVPTAPQITSAPRVIAGTPKFDTSGQSQGLYNLSPDIYANITGTQDYARQQAELNLGTQLNQQRQILQSVNQQRQLTL